MTLVHQYYNIEDHAGNLEITSYFNLLIICYICDFVIYTIYIRYLEKLTSCRYLLIVPFYLTFLSKINSRTQQYDLLQYFQAPISQVLDFYHTQKLFLVSSISSFFHTLSHLNPFEHLRTIVF